MHKIFCLKSGDDFIYSFQQKPNNPWIVIHYHDKGVEIEVFGPEHKPRGGELVRLGKHAAMKIFNAFWVLKDAHKDFQKNFKDLPGEKVVTSKERFKKKKTGANGDNCEFS